VLPKPGDWRGTDEGTEPLFSYGYLEGTVRKDYPLRTMTVQALGVLVGPIRDWPLPNLLLLHRFRRMCALIDAGESGCNRIELHERFKNCPDALTLRSCVRSLIGSRVFFVLAHFLNLCRFLMVALASRLSTRVALRNLAVANLASRSGTVAPFGRPTSMTPVVTLLASSNCGHVAHVLRADIKVKKNTAY
jgi:hypothetical protein